jgi:antitoxin (DNA-binding transcriptional repressor) of toxin-antitoxin stability system
MSEAVVFGEDEDGGAPVLGVREARDRFSDLVMRAAAAGDITRISRGRSHRTVAAIVPIEVLQAYEEFLDREDARIANERLAELDAGRQSARPAGEVFAELGL